MSPASPQASPLAAQALDECRTALLETLAGLLRDFKYQDMRVLNATLAAAREQFDTLVGIRNKKDFEAQRSLTASRISLVHEEDLEFSIRLSDLAQQLRERCELPLGQLHLRFMTLLDQQEAAPEQLPVGPETVGCAMRALASEAGLNPDERLRMLQEMRSELGRRLKAMYEQLNTRLEELGIEQRSLLRASSDRPTRRHEGFNPAAASAPASPALDPLLAGALRERMIAWLEDQIANGSGGAQVARQLSRTELGGLLPGESRAAVDCIEQAFERLSSHPGLPAAALEAIEGLRVPLLKLALRDQSLASDAGHPARQLLLALAREACELPSDAAPGSTQLNLIEACVSRLTREYKEDAAVFRESLGVLAQARQARLAALQRRVSPHAEGLAREERNELARRQAAQAIRALCAQEPPQTVRIFLEHYWSVVLRRTLMNYGDKSEEWKQALKVADTLVWSMQPRQNAEERERMVALLPRLLHHLQSGLEAIRVSAEGRDRLLQRFTALHTEALHGRDPKLVEPAVKSPPEEASRLDAVGGNEGLMILRRPGFIAREPALPASLGALAEGQALRFTLPDARVVSGAIAHISAQRQVFVLQLHGDNQLLAISWSELVRQHAEGTLQVGLLPDIFPA